MADSTSSITPLLVTGLLALLGTALGGVIKGYWDDDLAQRKFYSDMVLKAMESPDGKTRVETLRLLTRTHLIKDSEVQQGVEDVAKEYARNPNSSPQILSNAVGAVLAAPLTPTARIYLLTGRAQDKKDNGKAYLDSLRAPLQKASFSIIGARYLEDSGRPDTAEIRFFYPVDAPQAEQLADFFRIQLRQKNMAAIQMRDAAHRISGPGYIEIWTGRRKR